MNVPFLDLQAHHQPLRDEFLQAVGEVIDRGAFAGGFFVEEFEKEFALYCGTGSAIGVASGTDALSLALRALDIGPGDEVVTVPSTFFATAEAITLTGATPVFVDVCPDTCNMDPRALETAITPRTKAIIPVHLFGQPADMDPILELAQQRGLPVIEDAAQAHGAEYKGRRAGSMGRLGCFSFYPGKNLGAFGEAGAVVTNDPALDRRIRMLRDHGQSQKYHHQVVGWNARMDGIQAAVLRIKLRNLERNTKLRIAHANRYHRALGSVKSVTVLPPRPDVRHVYHIYPVLLDHRDEVIQILSAKGIGTGIHYPVPVHLQEAYQPLGYGAGSFPVAERAAKRLLSLPMFPELSEEQIEWVIEGLREAVECHHSSSRLEPALKGA